MFQPTTFTEISIDPICPDGGVQSASKVSVKGLILPWIGILHFLLGSSPFSNIVMSTLATAYAGKICIAMCRVLPSLTVNLSSGFSQLPCILVGAVVIPIPTKIMSETVTIVTISHLRDTVFILSFLARTLGTKAHVIISFLFCILLSLWFIFRCEDDSVLYYLRFFYAGGGGYFV